MPELPEVETVRRTLAPFVVGREIASVRVRRRDVIACPADPPGGFSRAKQPVAPVPKRVPGAWLLAGDRVERIERLGKQLALIGASGRAVVVHLGMSGRVATAVPGGRYPAETWGSAHDHVEWRLEGGGRFVFRDPRRFGGLKVSPSVEHLLGVRWAGLGPDALGVTGDVLRERAGSSHRPVKAALLDQRVIAGVGNIYADEACFGAGVLPSRTTAETTRAEWHAIAAALGRVLASAIEAGGSTLRDHTDAAGNPGAYRSSHLVYGRGGASCFTCGATLQQATLAGRTTCWCPDCQK